MSSSHQSSATFRPGSTRESTADPASARPLTEPYDDTDDMEYEPAEEEIMEDEDDDDDDVYEDEEGTSKCCVSVIFPWRRLCSVEFV